MTKPEILSFCLTYITVNLDEDIFEKYIFPTIWACVSAISDIIIYLWTMYSLHDKISLTLEKNKVH